MSINEIVTAVSTVGVSGLICFALLDMIKKQMSTLTDAINNNTVVINRLLERLGGDKDDK